MAELSSNRKLVKKNNRTENVEELKSLKLVRGIEITISELDKEMNKVTDTQVYC